ncbi:PQQ-dependent dehydrogenase, methanol/ethanol family [Halieaceae bacterium IMCC14734]|uniref:PQQ-dependent dehydrogenase, methanol/ethanol family n=1 Tax=Candidatus Litorirhabdus singularis TaxID=2518993 RepID=A0ABT3TJY2_9GAMM|nr:PQQ-dependent dehydrogenase, methanol/ethanol family [Candidatus Litorirhabdus singularis]MCX2982616.1 PQQ-dependent dehydrogenase, methanol/ethanol family [Candidatus Litorirhabdus singularis]
MPTPTELYRLLLCLLLTASAASVAQMPVDQPRLLQAASDGDNWLAHGRDLQETRFSPLTQINTDSVERLGLAWSFDVPSTRGLEGTPLIADGIMYATGNWSVVHALQADTGQLLWSYDPGVDRHRANVNCCGVVNRGVALWQDSVYVGTLDGYLVALDRATGAERWRTLTIDQSQPYAITGAPRIANGVVVIGNGGAEYGVRGYVGGYAADSGEQLWRFYTVPGNPKLEFENSQMEMAATTWHGEWWKMGGGGTVWDSISYDPQLDLLYIGVGNGGPHNREVRSPGGGDNLFLSSIVALRPQTGEYVWHYQQNPGETWDYTATQQMILADLPWQGEVRKVLMQAPKNGFFFIIDRTNGELLSAEPFVPVNWATGYDLSSGRPIEVPAARYVDEPFMLHPSGLGGHNWHPMSYNPQTGLVYLPALDFTAPMAQEDNFTWNQNHWNLGYKVERSPFGNLLTQALLKRLINSYLLAWDPIKQREVWRVPTPKMGNGGVLSSAGGLVFQGTTDNRFNAYSAAAGKLLWSFDSQHGIAAPPVTYAVNGEQYVAVMAGRGGGYSQAIGLDHQPATPKRRILAFKLDASNRLPAYELPASRERPPPVNADADAIDRGGQAYTRFCSRCHGASAVSDGSVPDLRKLNHYWYENFDEVVRGGSMSAMGMPAFDDVLSASATQDIKAYVLSRAHDQWEIDQTSDWWLDVKRWLADLAAAVLMLFA